LTSKSRKWNEGDPLLGPGGRSSRSRLSLLSTHFSLSSFCHLRSCSVFHARPPYENSTHAPTMRSTSTPLSGSPCCRESMQCFHSRPTSIQWHFSTEASRRASPTATRTLVRVRVAFCRFARCDYVTLRQPFSLSANDSFLPRTAPCSINHASKGLDLGVPASDISPSWNS